MNDWTVDYVMSFITWNNVLGATGALFYIISMSMTACALLAALENNWQPAQPRTIQLAPR